jgi:heme exporter protein C
MKRIPVYLLVLGVIGTVYTFLSPDAERFMTPELARIVYWHLPCAFITTGFVIAMAWQGFQYMRTKSLKVDVKQAACLEQAAIFAPLTLFTGMIFSRVQWGSFWHWDPKQTGFLFVVLLMGAAVALRSAFQDEHKRAASSAAYSIALLIPFIFLTFVYDRLPNVPSVHPSSTIAKGEMDAWYGFGVLGMFVIITLFAYWLYSQRVAAGNLGLEAADYNGQDNDDRSYTAPTGVVKSVDVQQDD